MRQILEPRIVAYSKKSFYWVFCLKNFKSHQFNWVDFNSKLRNVTLMKKLRFIFDLVSHKISIDFLWLQTKKNGLCVCYLYCVYYNLCKLHAEDIDPSVKKLILPKWVYLSTFVCANSISFKLKNNFLKLDSLRPTIYQIDGNSMSILTDLSDLK